LLGLPIHSALIFRSAVSIEHRQYASANATAAANLLAPGDNAAADVASYLETMRQTLTQDDFLAVPFDMNDAKDKEVFAALTRNKAGFQAWRENTARTGYHMELNDYEALFDKHRSSLLDLASSLDMPVENNRVSYQALLRKVDVEVAQRERRSPKGAATSFVEARVAIAALHEHTHLFNGRSTMHSLIVQDAIVYGVGEDIGKAFDWVVKNLNQHKCYWCKAVVIQIRRSLCQAAGKAICGLLVGLLSGPLGVVTNKFLCGFPVYLNSIFSGWCIQGVAFIQDKLSLSNDCLCSFSVPNFVIPATDFKVLGVSVFKSSRHDIQIGQICPTKVGQCAGSSQAEKDKFADDKKVSDAARAAAAAAEAEKVKKMTVKEKIAYHSKILAGEVKTNLTDRMVSELLTAFTGMGQAVGGTLLKGAKELVKGNVKGAVASVAADAAKTTVKAAAKAVASTAAVAIAKSSIGSVTTVAVNNVGKQVMKGVAAGSTIVANNAAAAVNTVGTLGVKTAAAVTKIATGDAQKAAAVTAKGNALVKNATAKTNATAKAVSNTLGKFTVDTAKIWTNSHIGAKVLGPAADTARNGVNYVFDPKKTDATGSF